MPRKKIDWEKIWKKFNNWIDRRDAPTCPKCGCSNYNYPEWDEQQKKIQQLINKQLGL